MIYTGQTGWMQGARYGVALDAIPSQFCAGELEATVVEAFQKESPDVIIVDLVMPEMDGGDTFDMLKKINKDVKVILSSGYSIDGKAQEIMSRGCNGFIQKPFSMQDLSSKIRGILD